MKTVSRIAGLGARGLLGIALALVVQQAQAQTDLPLSGPAYQLADKAYQAYARGDYATAVESSREAVRLRPDHAPLRALLARSLMAQAAPPTAVSAAPRAVPKARPISPSLAAIAQLPDLPLVTEEPMAEALAATPADTGFDAADAAYKAYAAADYAQAVASAQQAVQLAPQNPDYARLLLDSQLRLLNAQGRKPAARLHFDEALTSGRFIETPAVEVAYLAASVGNDPAAHAAFEQADASGALPNTAIQDAGFAALRVQQDAQAIAYFKRSIDAARSLQLALSPKMLFDTRRTVTEVSRRSGVIASLSYRGTPAGLGQVPGRSDDSLQAGVEAYWRPWGYQNGRHAEVFARGFGTLYSENQNATGIDSLQAALGARYKPLRDINLIGSFSRVFSAKEGRNDWLAQLGYSGGSGTDLQADVPMWSTARVSAEVGRYLSDGDSYALASAEFGPSTRLGDADARWVLFPHVSLATDYDSTAIEQGASGLGGGVGARYWFREDPYHAPRSYWDTTLQYRFKVEGAERAEGVFATSTLSY